MQFTANATGRIVKAVLPEGTSVGNIMMQAFGMGYVNNLSEIRQIIGNSFDISIFQPIDNLKWEKAFNSYRQAIKAK